jgi:cell division protease FtsH
VEQLVQLVFHLKNSAGDPETKHSDCSCRFWSVGFNSLIELYTLHFDGVFFFMFIRQAQGSNNAAYGFWQIPRKNAHRRTSTVTFADVAGVEEAKEELQEVVEFLKEPQKFIALGARIPKGVLLVDPPHWQNPMAKAVSGEAGVPFFSNFRFRNLWRCLLA